MLTSLNCEIGIGNLLFNNVVNVEIASSSKELCDTCTITIPKNIRLGDKVLKDVLQKNDEVFVKLGYDGNLIQEFSGYVVKTEPSTPFILKCEDDMFKLKQTNVTQSFKKETLHNILSTILPKNTAFKCADFTFGYLRINQVSIAKFLMEIQQAYGFDSFYQNKTLFVGYDNEHTNAKKIQFGFQTNIVESDLVYKLKNEASVGVKSISLLPNNDSIDYISGDENGELITKSFYNLQKEQLVERAENILQGYQYDGYRGSVTCFGIPYVQHGNVVDIYDNEYPERAGRYLVLKTRTMFGINGFRRIIELGKKYGST